MKVSQAVSDFQTIIFTHCSCLLQELHTLAISYALIQLPSNAWREHKLWSSSLRNFLHPPFTSSLLGPNILLSIFFSNAFQQGTRQRFISYNRLLYSFKSCKKLFNPWNIKLKKLSGAYFKWNFSNFYVLPIYQNEGRAVAQRLDAGFPPRRPGFAYGQHVGFVVDKAALGQIFSEYLGFPCQSFHQFLHNHNHPGLTQ
jgi:hypothetical protein